MCEFNPKIEKQTISSVELSWNTIPNCDVYKIEILSEYLSPNRVYWLIYGQIQFNLSTLVNFYIIRGSNRKSTIENLSENTCYKFQITALKSNGFDYLPVSISTVFRASTLPNVPSTISINRAVRKSQEYLLKRFLKTKPSLINVPGPNGLTPLANAVVYGNKDCVRILLESGANVDHGCLTTKRTPLQVSVIKIFDLVLVCVIVFSYTFRWQCFMDLFQLLNYC